MPLDSDFIDALRSMCGVDQVRTDLEALQAASHDTWPMTTKWSILGRHPYPADVVVRPSRVEQIPEVLMLCTSSRVPLTVRSHASSVTGQPIPTRGGVVLDVTGLPAWYDIDETDLIVRASANFSGGELEDILAEQGYTLGHSPQSLYRSSVGGWLATLATGQFSSLYGGIEDLVVAYTVYLATGEKVELVAKPRAAMGPDLRQLFIGAEGTLAVITEVALKIFPRAETQLLGAYALPSVHDGLGLLRAQAAAGLRPFLLRLYDEQEARHAMVDASFATPVLFTGSRGPKPLAEAEFALLDALIRDFGGTPLGPDPTQAWMDRRFDFSSVEKRVAIPGGIAETLEVAHYWSQIESLYEVLRDALAPLVDEVLVHWSHVYTQGASMYLILFGQVADDEAAIKRLDQVWTVTMDICLEHGAELSHHHGGGLIRSPYSKRALGSAHLVLSKVKDALDPSHILNPGKLGLT